MKRSTSLVLRALLLDVEPNKYNAVAPKAFIAAEADLSLLMAAWRFIGELYHVFPSSGIVIRIRHVVRVTDRCRTRSMADEQLILLSLQTAQYVAAQVANAHYRYRTLVDNERHGDR